jgi:hypothetical protein
MISKYYWQDSRPWDKRKYIEPALKIILLSVDFFNYDDPSTDEVIIK